MILDWRELAAEQVAPLYRQQAGEWVGGLGWDLSRSWVVVERARAAGALPGLVYLDGRSRVAGWTFFMRQDDVIQIGALTGHGAVPVRELLEGVLNSPEAAGAHELTCLLYPPRSNALSALTRRRFTLQSLRYYARDIAPEPIVSAAVPDALSIGRWRDGHALGCVRVVARAYENEASGRSIAPHGTLEEWAHHLGQILRTPACGVLLPKASFVAEDRSSGAIAAFLLATTVGPDTAHVAQLAVDPRWVRQGAGRALIRHASRAAAAEGFRRISVLLPGDSDPAMRLLASEGFVESSQVVFASRTMPVRRQVASRRVA